MPTEFPSSIPYDGSADDAPVSKLWYGVIIEGLRKGHERVHVAPTGDSTEFVIRACHEGAWADLMRLPAQMYGLVVRRLKVMASLDLVRRTSFGEGRFILVHRDARFEIKATVRVRDDGQEEVMVDLPVLPPNKRLKLAARVD